MSNAAARLGLLVVLALALLPALAACSGASPNGPVSVSGTAADAPPSTENTTAVEEPQAPGEDRPGISVASLPIGDPDGSSVVGDGGQCIHVTWIQSSSAIPQGLGVLVTGAGFQPEVYRLDGFSCERPTCVGYVFRGSDLTCDLPIRPRRESETILLDRPPVTLALQGQVLCTDFAADWCSSFAREVRDQAKTLSLQRPAAPPSTPDSTGETDTPPGTSSSSPSGEPGSNPGG